MHNGPTPSFWGLTQSSYFEVHFSQKLHHQGFLTFHHWNFDIISPTFFPLLSNISSPGFIKFLGIVIPPPVHIYLPWGIPIEYLRVLVREITHSEIYLFNSDCEVQSIYLPWGIPLEYLRVLVREITHFQIYPLENLELRSPKHLSLGFMSLWQFLLISCSRWTGSECIWDWTWSDHRVIHIFHEEWWLPESSGSHASSSLCNPFSIGLRL